MMTQRASLSRCAGLYPYARQFTQPITQLANIANVIQSTIASAERIFELLDEPRDPLIRSMPKVLTTPRGSVKFRAC